MLVQGSSEGLEKQKQLADQRAYPGSWNQARLWVWHYWLSSCSVCGKFTRVLKSHIMLGSGWLRVSTGSSPSAQLKAAVAQAPHPIQIWGHKIVGGDY